MNDEIAEVLELMHAGVAHDKNPPGRGSGRYAFGTGARPNQRSSRKAKKAAKKAAEARAKAREEAKKKEEERQRFEAEKARILREGTATEVLKYKNEFNEKELSTLSKKFENIGKIKTASKDDKVPDNWDKIDNVMKRVKMVSDWTSTAVNAKKNLDSLIELMGAGSSSSKKSNESNNEIDKKLNKILENLAKSAPSNQGQQKKK